MDQNDNRKPNPDHRDNVIGGSVALGVVGLAVGGPVLGVIAAATLPIGDRAFRLLTQRNGEMKTPKLEGHQQKGK